MAANSLQNKSWNAKALSLRLDSFEIFCGFRKSKSNRRRARLGWADIECAGARGRAEKGERDNPTAWNSRHTLIVLVAGYEPHTQLCLCVFMAEEGLRTIELTRKKKPEFQRASRHFRSLTRSSPLQPINGADYLVSLELHFDCKGSRIHKTVKNCTPTEENR